MRTPADQRRPPRAAAPRAAFEPNMRAIKFAAAFAASSLKIKRNIVMMNRISAPVAAVYDRRSSCPVAAVYDRRTTLRGSRRSAVADRRYSGELRRDKRFAR